MHQIKMKSGALVVRLKCFYLALAPSLLVFFQMKVNSAPRLSPLHALLTVPLQVHVTVMGAAS